MSTACVSAPRRRCAFSSCARSQNRQRVRGPSECERARQRHGWRSGGLPTLDLQGLRVCCIHRRKSQLPGRADSMSTTEMTRAYKSCSPQLPQSSVPRRVGLYCAITRISSGSLPSRAIRLVVPICLARLKRHSQIASDAGVAKNILAAFAIKGKRDVTV